MGQRSEWGCGERWEEVFYGEGGRREQSVHVVGEESRTGRGQEHELCVSIMG